MKSYNTANKYQFSGGAALDSRMSYCSKSSFNVIEGGCSLDNPYIVRQNCRSAQLNQAGLLTSSQILATQLCLFVTTALVFAMWVFMH